MITLKSNYSPAAAAEEQETDNVKMLEMLLYFGGLSPAEVQNYMDNGALASKLYNEALGEPEQEREGGPNIHSQAQWEAAKEAAASPLAMTRDMLSGKGVTINNILIKADDPGYFSWIKTTVYTGGAEMVAVAQIERPVSDIEAETYKNNLTGYAAVHDDAVVPVEPEPIEEEYQDPDEFGDINDASETEPEPLH